MPNRLAGETSPYLQQHAHNPVEWQPWDEQALSQARRDNRPILLSIGYSACHWCHVMAHESFEDGDVAATMNRLFVNIKVDREERPDLDQIYQAAYQLLSGQAGGWPLTMFLAPDGTPFYGGTYFPKEPRHGLPAFATLCERVAAAWDERRDDAIAPQNASLRKALATLAPPAEETPSALHGRPIEALRRMLGQNCDRRHGGFGGAPKFPHPMDLRFLLRRHGLDGDGEALDMALTTLRRMAEGGLYDQLGGGFCRYSVDERWEIPHFEKMLYDNGPLLGLYADAWAVSREPLFARVGAETAAWAMAEMQSPEGGFYSSLDADSEGEEGRFYVWRQDEVRAALEADEWAAAARVWGLDGPPNFENCHWHLRVARPLAEDDSAARGLLDAARAKLLALRARRVRPGRDEKILTSWNALMIEGLARAGRIFGRPQWLAAARRALGFVRAHLWRADEGRLLATAKDGHAHLNAYLDDYAYLLAALLELHQADLRPDELALSRAVADALLDRFEDAAAGGFFFTAHDHEQLIARWKSAQDGSTAAGNGVAACALQRLGTLLGESRYLEAARRTVAAFWPQLRLPAGGFTTMLLALEEALEPPRVVMLRGPAAPVEEWQRTLAGHTPPDAMVIALPNGLAALPPAMAKPDSPTVNAWVCSGVTCLAPIGNLAELQQVLAVVPKGADIV